jgi:hypothetical protein
MNPTTANRAANQLIHEDELRAVAIQELGLEKISQQAQDDIFKTMRESMVIYIQTALLQALGSDKVAALDVVPEGNDELFAQQLAALLPDSAQVVQEAMEACINDHKKAFAQAHV